MSENTNNIIPTVLFNRVTWPWMESRSGYDLIVEYLESGGFGMKSHSIHVPHSNLNFLQRRTLKSFYWSLRPHESHTLAHAWAEREVMKMSRKVSPDLIYYLVGDKCLSLAGARPESFRGKLMATLHQPPAWWKLHHTRHEYLRCLEAAITMSSEQAEFFSELIKGPVIFIPHGVDTVFFSPSQEPESTRPFHLFVGHHHRDFEALYQTVEKVLKTDPGIDFYFVIPYSARTSTSLRRMARHSRCHFFAKLNLDELRSLYRRAVSLFMPVVDATANNALVEAMACGLPLVGTDCQGLRDYCSESAGVFIEGNDPDMFVSALSRMVSDSGMRDEASKAARKEAEENLAWPLIAKRTFEVIQSVAIGNKSTS